MKIPSLLSGIGLSLNLLAELVNFAMHFTSIFRYSATYFPGQVVWFFAQICMIIFFFSFYARAKE